LALALARRIERTAAAIALEHAADKLQAILAAEPLAGDAHALAVRGCIDWLRGAAVEEVTGP
ncbi:hypothetical protein, partial [Pseudomonas sp.]|uniref:hypothetical protein n=1 Tax=Pseudomonas sp. TaxID=306 RepID=UPI00261AD8B0